MKVKSQISLFAILGILLLFIALIGIYLVSSIKENKIKTAAEEAQKLSLQKQPIEVFTEECLKKVAFESAYEFGLKQGFHNMQVPFLDTNYSSINYYYYRGKGLIPTKYKLEQEFSKTVVDNILLDCTDFFIFENMGYAIDFEDTNSSATILDDKILLEIYYPLTTIKKDEVVYTTSKFSYTLPFRIGYIINVSHQLVNSIAEEPYSRDLTLLLNFDVDITVIPYDDCNDFYIIVDNKSKSRYRDDDYVFTFAVGYDKQYCRAESNFSQKIEIQYPEFENNAPILEEIPYQIAEVGKPYIYRLRAYDSDNDTLFYLNDETLKNYTHPLTGVINFTPKIEQIGIYQINATVVDINGGLDVKQFYLELK